jgi:predicted MFS family arabinose efflux permease
MTSPQTPEEAATTPAPPSIGSLRERYGERYRWYLLLSVMVGTMASIMSSTIVNVAIPGMSHHFSLGQERAQWVSSGFMVAMTVSMLTTPWLLSRYGYRRTYVGTMVLLLIGGIVGGLANNFSLVLFARVAEGLAAGVVQPIPAIIILRAFEPHEQGRASGIFGMGVVLAPAIGPSIGGVLVDLFGWRSIFFMVVPFCLASLWLAYKFVPKTAPGGVAAVRGSGLDTRGLAMGTVGTLCLLNGLVELRGDSPLQAGLLLAGALASFAVFVWWQRRLAASHVGTILLPAGIVLAVTIAGVGRLADKHPTWILVTVGLVLLAVSFALMMLLRLDSALWLLVAFAIIGRIGLGFILPSLNLGSMRPLAKPLIPQGASAINFVRMLGGAAGVSLCAIVLEWRLAAHGDSLANPMSSPARLAAFDEVFAMLAGLCALAVIAAWQLREGRREG